MHAYYLRGFEIEQTSDIKAKFYIIPSLRLIKNVIMIIRLVLIEMCLVFKAVYLTLRQFNFFFKRVTLKSTIIAKLNFYIRCSVYRLQAAISNARNIFIYLGT